MNPNSVSRGPTPDADQVMEIDSNVISGLPAVPSFPAVSDISVVDAFKQLKGEISVLFVRIATVGSKPRSEIDPLVAFLNRKKADLESLEGVVGMLALGVARSEFSVTSILHHFAGVARNNVVPDGLPLFQWTGFSWYMDVNWCRLLPRCLSNDLRDWLNEFLPLSVSGACVTWSALKSAISGRYGVQNEQLRFACIREFLACSKRDSESVVVFVERFKSLRAKSGISDKYVYALVFFDAFPEATANLMTVAMGQASEQSIYDINYLSAVARQLDMAVGSKKVGNGDGSSGAGRRKRESSDVFSISQELKKSKHAPFAVRSAVAEISRTFDVKPPFLSKFGKTIREHVAESTCKDCNGPYSKGHKCGTGVRDGAGGGRGSKTICVLAKGPERNVGASAVRCVDFFVGALAGGDTSGETVAILVISVEDDVVMFCVDSAEANLADHDDLKSRAEATLVDKMSNVSFIDAELAMNMAAQEEGSSFCGFAAVNDDSVVHLAHEIATLSRLGEVSLDISYNKAKIHDTFEVFSFYSVENVHVLLGMDILSTLGIGIVGAELAN
ncbi:hypothetical protein [Parasitella parasitica]|uniref:Retrotransposon gag domain-containing protein n=1 Tax=Parasitella parasitica TaxID=35722 RepID=A0A0B7NQ96_9FUNG|nr:hypothetical protein [Parasitella parasitica]